MDDNDLLDELHSALEQTVKEKSKIDETLKITKKSINERVNFLREQIGKIEESLLRCVSETLQEERERLENYEQQLHEWIAYLKENTTGEGNGNGENAKTQNLDESRSTIEQLLVYEHRHVKFNPGADDDSSLLDIVGKIDDYRIKLSHSAHTSASFISKSAELIADFECQGSLENIHAIAPISENEAWLCSRWGSKEIHLYNTMGEIKVSVTLDIRVNDICVGDNGDVLISSYNGNLIQRLDKDLKISTFLSLDFISRGMVVSNKRELFVCGVERICSSHDDAVEDVRRHVISKFLLDGTHVLQINTCPHDPNRIALTADDMLCFSTYGSNSDRQIIYMTTDGDITSSYQEETSLTKQFYPLGVVSDSMGNILISDWNNDCIVLLSKSGRFKRFLVTKEHGVVSPSALAIDQKGRLWIGNATGAVMVYEYLL